METIVEKNTAVKKENPVKKSIKYLQDKDKEKVKGIFRFYEVPGGLMEFSFGPIYKGDRTEKYSLRDGQVYTLPLGVAKHLNKNCWYPIHAHMQDEQGNPSMKINQKVRRCGFQSLEFVDIDEISPHGDLISVESI